MIAIRPEDCQFSIGTLGVPSLYRSFYLENDDLTILFDYSSHALGRTKRGGEKVYRFEDITDILTQVGDCILDAPIGKVVGIKSIALNKGIVCKLMPCTDDDKIVMQVITVLAFNDGRTLHFNDLNVIEQ